MYLHSGFVIGILLSCLSRLILTAPMHIESALVNCVERALIGEDVESRIVTPSNDTYSAASVGGILYVTQSELQDKI